MILCGAGRVLLVVTILVVAAPCSNHEDDHVKGLYESLAEDCELVVVGKVTRVESRWLGRHIVSAAEVEVLDTLRGRADSSGIIVAYLGGTVNNILEIVSHQTVLFSGEISVLFLNRQATLAGERFDHFAIVSEAGRVTLVRPGQRASRMRHNRRINARLAEITAQVQDAGGTR